MAIKRIELAISSDDSKEEAVPIVSGFVDMLNLSLEDDVAGVLTSGSDGSPVLVAVIYPGAGNDETLDPEDLLVEEGDIDDL